MSRKLKNVTTSRLMRITSKADLVELLGDSRKGSKGTYWLNSSANGMYWPATYESFYNAVLHMLDTHTTIALTGWVNNDINHYISAS